MDVLSRCSRVDNMQSVLHHGSIPPLENLPAETERMAGGALAAAPEDDPAVIVPCGLDRLQVGSSQGFDAGPSGKVWER